MAIQQSVNSALGTLGVVAGGVKHLKNQQQKENKVDKKELKELSIENDTVSETIGSVNSDIAHTDEQLENTSNEAMNAINDFYNAQESGQPTDIQMYNKAMQSYKDKIQALQLQRQGNEQWLANLEKRRMQIQERMNSIQGGKK